MKTGRGKQVFGEKTDSVELCLGTEYGCLLWEASRYKPKIWHRQC